MQIASAPSWAVSTMQPYRSSSAWAAPRTESSASTTSTRRPRRLGRFSSCLACGMGLRRGHFLADLLNHLLDVAGVAENALQTFDDFRLVADVALHDVHGVVEDVVDRQGHRAVNRLDVFRRGGRFFGHQQFERVERHGHVAGENLQEHASRSR